MSMPTADEWLSLSLAEFRRDRAMSKQTTTPDHFAAFLQKQIERAARDEKTARDDYMQAPMDDTETAIDYERAKEHFSTLAFVARKYQTLKGAN